jgi:hypothetical protein
MTDQKSEKPKPDTPLDKPAPDKSVTPGVGPSPSDWNPNQKPLDGSPVLTAVPQHEPAVGQTGHKPKTVAEHNAEVEAIAEERRTGKHTTKDTTKDK